MNNKNEKTVQAVKEDLVAGEQTHAAQFNNVKATLTHALNKHHSAIIRDGVFRTLDGIEEARDLEADAVEHLIQYGTDVIEGGRVANSTLFAVRNPRWWLNLGATAIGVVAAKEGYDALRGVVAKQITKHRAKTAVNPFADTTAADTPRTLRNRREPSVAAVN